MTRQSVHASTGSRTTAGRGTSEQYSTQTASRHERKSSAPTPVSGADAGALVEFVADRAHGLADALHQMATQRIDGAQASLQRLHVDSILWRAQPLLRGAGRFVRENPLRFGAIVILLGMAAALTRPAFSTR